MTTLATLCLSSTQPHSPMEMQHLQMRRHASPLPQQTASVPPGEEPFTCVASDSRADNVTALSLCMLDV